jgi:hypothetical protein
MYRIYSEAAFNLARLLSDSREAVREPSPACLRGLRRAQPAFEDIETAPYSLGNAPYLIRGSEL